MLKEQKVWAGEVEGRDRAVWFGCTRFKVPMKQPRGTPTGRQAVEALARGLVSLAHGRHF